VDDVTQAPELAFEDPLQHNDVRAFEKTAHQIPKIHHLNQSKTDAFREALFTQRDDLRGLPLVLGQACRTKVERSRLLSQATETIRNALNQQISMPLSDARNAPQRAGEQFWMAYQLAVVKEDRANAAASKEAQEDLLLVRIAALMQVLGPETSALRKGLVKYLATLSHAEASKALAKLVIFSPEDDIRQAAIDALKVRRERDYADVLLKGLRYPLPAVAQRASEALVQLERNDVVPQLVAFLDEPDARAPFQGEVKGKKGTLVRELVRVNHHRNCLLCHAPVKVDALSGEFVSADMPIPGRPLPTPSQGYQSTIPDILVRIDVTYLRQDFSMMQPVAEAHPWPTEQRFDFLVRTRALTDQEAKSFRSLFESRKENPYRDAAWAALRKLTGRDVEPSSAAWRKELALRSQ